MARCRCAQCQFARRRERQFDPEWTWGDVLGMAAIVVLFVVFLFFLPGPW